MVELDQMQKVKDLYTVLTSYDSAYQNLSKRVRGYLDKNSDNSNGASKNHCFGPAKLVANKKAK